MHQLFKKDVESLSKIFPLLLLLTHADIFVLCFLTLYHGCVRSRSVFWLPRNVPTFPVLLWSWVIPRSGQVICPLGHKVIPSSLDLPLWSFQKEQILLCLMLQDQIKSFEHYWSNASVCHWWAASSQWQLSEKLCLRVFLDKCLKIFFLQFLSSAFHLFHLHKIESPQAGC